jgi:hypothetical protein
MLGVEPDAGALALALVGGIAAFALIAASRIMQRRKHSFAVIAIYPLAAVGLFLLAAVALLIVANLFSPIALLIW